MPDADLIPFSEAPTFTFFHSRQWLDALLGAFPSWRDVSHVYILPDGRRVWLPLLETDRVGPWRWLESSPFGFIGGPVAEAGCLDTDDLAFLVKTVGGRVGWLALNLDPADPLAVPGVIGVGAVSLVTHLLALEHDFEAVQRRFTKTANYDARRAEKDGVSARRGYGRQDFATYYALMELAARERWGLSAPPFPRALYEALAVLPVARVHLWLAEHEGEVVGGLINIHYAPNRVMHWSSAIRPGCERLNPTKLLQREAIREACEGGATVYNMGPSVGFDGKPLEGVRRAKEALGARAHDYCIVILMDAWAMRARSLRGRVRSLFSLRS